MTRLSRALRRLVRNRAGSMAIETALVAPMLVLLSIGGFETSRMVMRQHELQSGVSEAEALALAANMGAETQTGNLAAMLQQSLDLTAQQVSVSKKYRCRWNTALITDKTTCSSYDEDEGDFDDKISEYLILRIEDSYSPIWNKLGILGPVNYVVERRVQLS